MDLTGRKALITGAAQGIGYEIARRLHADGCRVALLDINEEKVKQSAASLSRGIGIACDVSHEKDILAAVDQAAKELGGLDIIVNNAGILRNTGILDVTEEEWDTVMAVNLKSVFFTVQKALPYLQESGHARVINISSLAGRMGGFETGLAYTASKGGMLSLTMGLARRLAPFRITVNAVCPSTTETPITEEFSPAAMERLLAVVPLGRLGKPEDVAAAVSFLASDDASYITGLLMDVNGGTYMG